MRRNVFLRNILLVVGFCIGATATADAPLVFCVGTECGGSGPRSYAYEVDSASFPMMEFRVGTNDLNPESYSDVLIPPGWMFAIEDLPMTHMHDTKTPHGEISPGPCRCLTSGSALWWTEDPEYTVESFTFGFDHPAPSEDVGWILATRREGPPPESYRFEVGWDSPVGTGYGPLHGPVAVEIQGYQLVPALSHLRITGGFMGIDINHSIIGGMDLILDRSPDAPDEPWAQFVNVDASLPSYPFLESDLDELIKLSEMEGVFVDTDEIIFCGSDIQGLKMVIQATLVENGIYLSGQTESMCCDFFDLHFEAFGLLEDLIDTIPRGDFNGDLRVAEEDLLIWQAGFGMQNATASEGDADADEDADGNDFLIWQQEHGLGIGQLNTLAIPEPSSVILLFTITVLALIFRIGVPRFHEICIDQDGRLEIFAGE